MVISKRVPFVLSKLYRVWKAYLITWLFAYLDGYSLDKTNFYSIIISYISVGRPSRTRWCPWAHCVCWTRFKHRQESLSTRQDWWPSWPCYQLGKVILFLFLSSSSLYKGCILISCSQSSSLIFILGIFQPSYLVMSDPIIFTMSLDIVLLSVICTLGDDLRDGCITQSFKIQNLWNANFGSDLPVFDLHPTFDIHALWGRGTLVSKVWAKSLREI